MALANLRALLELKVPESIPLEGSISARDLAGKVGADEALIGMFAQFTGSRFCAWC